MKFTGFTRHAGLTLGLLVLAANALASPASYRLRVDGLACPFCAYGIEKQLSKLDGVARVETDIGDGVVVVTMKEGAAMDASAARKAVEKAGFTLEGLEAAAPDA